MPVSKRDQLLTAAIELFNEAGYHNTGVDTVVTRSGVSKMTLYAYFKTKEELILAALRRQDEEMRNALMRDVERREKDPRARLPAFFDALGDWFSQSDFKGCMFINASAEYTAQDHSVHLVAAEHKRLLTKYVRDLAAAAGAPDPDDLADQLMLLIEGAIVTAHVRGSADSARRAKKAAEILISDALGPVDKNEA